MSSRITSSISSQRAPRLRNSRSTSANSDSCQPMPVPRIMRSWLIRAAVETALAIENGSRIGSTKTVVRNLMRFVICASAPNCTQGSGQCVSGYQRMIASSLSG